MKRIYTIIALAILFAMGIGKAHAQVVDVCAGNDSVELQLGNYQYGYVQWQVSEDNETWSDIDGAINTVYRFLPERPQYYRAEVRFPACMENNYYSQVSYVQMPPKAFAGPDLTIPAGTVTRMNATRVEGAEGEWNIIEGVGGLLENPTDCRSGFIGEEGEYKLTWTVTNSCGSNTDTVLIKCVRMEYQTDLVIVDETDAILSDSTQRLNGEYIISFNEPMPDIQVGSVLLGYMYPSFLRKVVSFEREGNLFIMQTEQGVLTDVIASGAINIDLTADSINGSKPAVKYLDRFPTRKELKENPFLLRDGSVYFVKNASRENEEIDFEIVTEITTEGYLSFKILEFDFKKLSSKLDGLKFSSEFRVYPNFNANIVFENLDFKEARIGFYDARLENIHRIRLTKPLSTTLVSKEGCFNKTQILLGGFLIGYIPTLVVLDFPYVFKVQASLEPPMSYTITTGNTYTYEMYYNPQMTVPSQRNEKGTPYQHTSYEMPIGSIGAQFETGFKASVLLLDVLGPYFEVRGNFNPSICASSETNEIGGNINMGVNLGLGCRFQLFSNRLTLFDRRILDFRVVDYNEPAPKKIIKYGGDNQVYTYGQYLNLPVSVKVNGWFNTPMPLAYVHFKPENGVVSDSVVAADISGIATTRWKPGVQYGMDKLRVKVYDCYGNLAGETPQTFHAYSSATDPCINSNLTVEAYEVAENTIIPRVSGGRTPYLYSTDGESYGTTQPTIHTQPGHNYHLCVRDANGCEAETWYNSPFYDCNNTTLQINTMVAGNSVTVSAFGGFEPYQYSIGGDFQLSGLFGSLYDGEYTVTVRDALGCERSKHVVISRPGSLNISITEITNGSGNAMVLTETTTLIDRGICWSTHHTPTVQDFHNSYGPGSGYYTFTITALDPTKTYYVRAYAFDASGTSYSREVCINPSPNTDLPVVAATGITNVGETSAVGSGNVTYEGGSPVTERGICWGMIVNPTIASSHVSCGSGTGAFTANITELTPNRTYYARAYATNSYGTAYGEQVEFFTGDGGGGNIPQVITTEITDITSTTATCWFQVLSGLPIQGAGVCYSTHPLPTVDDYMATLPQSGDYVGYLSGLIPNTTYYVRAYAFNVNMNFCYGNELNFTTLPDGNGEIPEGAINGLFSVGEGHQVYFSKGNLQYGPEGFHQCADGTIQSGSWRFAENQWDYVGDSNNPYVGWKDLYGWGTSGWNCGNTYYAPEAFYYGSDEYGPPGLYDLTGDYANSDWGVYNAINNGGNTINTWRTPSDDEWEYVFNTRNTISGIRYAKAQVNGENGVILLPDDWSDSYYSLGNTNSGSASFSNNIIDYSAWMSSLQAHGAVFLPAAGFRDGRDVYQVNSCGYYWSASTGYFAFSTEEGVEFSDEDLSTSSWYYRDAGNSVRLIHDANHVPVGQLPQVTTSEVSVFYNNSAVCGGNVISDGGSPVTERGVCWSTTPNPTINGDHASAGSGIGEFTVLAPGIIEATTYYARAYAINGVGIAYGNEVEFMRHQGGGTGGECPEGGINAVFTINEGGDLVYFSQGNLQYQASTNTWKFAEHQWDYVGEGNNNISSTYDGWIDLFGWGTSGYDHGAVCYQPWSTDMGYTNYFAYGNSDYNLYDQTGQADWGYNPINNGVNQENLWRVLTQSEWSYVLNTRNTISGIRYAKACVNGVNGLILVSDQWDGDNYTLVNPDIMGAPFDSNIIALTTWESQFENSGCVFLPAAGLRMGVSTSNANENGIYWSATCNSIYYADYIDIYGVEPYPMVHSNRYYGLAVRLVYGAGSGSGNGGGGGH